MTKTDETNCQHPADQGITLLMTCPDCGAKCSGTQVGDDDLCYDERCPLHAMEGELPIAAEDAAPDCWLCGALLGADERKVCGACQRSRGSLSVAEAHALIEGEANARGG